MKYTVFPTEKLNEIPQRVCVTNNRTNGKIC